MTILFVYGTLKRGQRNHHLIQSQKFLDEATTMPLYRLYALGWFPGMVLDVDNGLEVKGELWEVDDATLEKMDEYEGVPDLFVRQDVAIRDCFETVQAFLYNRALPADAVSGNEWPFEI